METNWICTDPDMNQWGRKIKENIYQFKQDMMYPDGTIIEEEGEINLNHYTDEEINNHLSPYGWNIQKLKEDNTLGDAKWLMAECIFEQTSY